MHDCKYYKEEVTYLTTGVEPNSRYPKQLIVKEDRCLKDGNGVCAYLSCKECPKIQGKKKKKEFTVE